MTKVVDNCERIERLEADAWYKAWYSAVSLVIGAILWRLAEISDKLREKN
jgi:hypothetical protein